MTVNSNRERFCCTDNPRGLRIFHLMTVQANRRIKPFHCRLALDHWHLPQYYCWMIHQILCYRLPPCFFLFLLALISFHCQWPCWHLLQNPWKQTLDLHKSELYTHFPIPLLEIHTYEIINRNNVSASSDLGEYIIGHNDFFKRTSAPLRRRAFPCKSVYVELNLPSEYVS